MLIDRIRQEKKKKELKLLKKEVNTKLMKNLEQMNQWWQYKVEKLELFQIYLIEDHLDKMKKL